MLHVSCTTHAGPSSIFFYSQRVLLSYMYVHVSKGLKTINEYSGETKMTKYPRKTSCILLNFEHKIRLCILRAWQICVRIAFAGQVWKTKVKLV